MRKAATMLLILSVATSGSAQQKHNWKEWLANGIHAGAAIADVEMTQSCLRAKTCREGNPLMPSNRAGAYSLSLGMVVGQGFIAHKLRKAGKRFWWFGPAAGTASHAIGITSGALK